MNTEQIGEWLPAFRNHTARLAGEQPLTMSKHSNTSKQASKRHVVILLLKIFFFLRAESQWAILEFDCNNVVFMFLSDALMEREVWRSCKASVRVHHHQCTACVTALFFLSEALAGWGLFTANHTCRNLTLNAADSVYKMFPFFLGSNCSPLIPTSSFPNYAHSRC